jgi:hypothetical protein
VFLRRSERLPLVATPLESVFALKWVLLVPLAAVETTLLKLYLGSKGALHANGSLFTSGLVLFAAQFLLIQIPNVNDALDSFIRKLKRMIVLSCPAVVHQPLDDEWQPFCWFIPDGYRQPRFRYDSQEFVVDRIRQRLTGEQNTKLQFVYVEGQSGQGKTQTVFLLLQTLLRHPTLCALAERAFLYDMAASHATQKALYQRLDSYIHDDALVFIDNFHRVEPGVLSRITEVLLKSTPSIERMIILLGQPSEAWLLHPTTEVRLLSCARGESAYFSLKGTPSALIAERLARRPGGENWTRIFGPATQRPATVAQLQFAQAITRSGRHVGFVVKLFEIIEGKLKEPPTRSEQELTCCLGIVTSLSLYSGTFRKRDFWRACINTSKHTDPFRLTIECLRKRLLLFKMSRIGLMPSVPTRHSQLVFHESMAEHCKDALRNNEVFCSCFAATARLRRATKPDDPVLTWLLSCELHDVEAMEQTFERAVLYGSLAPMVRCLDRNWEALRNCSAIGYQYALLLDKSGRFAESRRIFEQLEIGSAEEATLAERVELARVEVFHGEQAYSRLSRITESQDPGNRIAARYWRIHLDTHLGVFQPEELMALGRQLGDSFTRHQIENSYFLVHTAARIFFDAHRHVYLAGEHVQQRLSELKELELAPVLTARLPQYRAFSILYREAHLLAHEVLPRLVFWGEPSDLSFVADRIPDDGANTRPASIVKLTLQAYVRARDEFATYGDRESLYLQADILNFEMLREDTDLESFGSKWNSYAEFISRAGFADIFSYPQFYLFRWHMLKHYQWVDSGDHESDPEEVETAYSHLNKAEEYDRSCGNAYGLWRTTVYKELIRRSIAGDNLEVPLRQSLTELARVAADRGYVRDCELLSKLLEHSKIPLADVRKFILFCPFVHQ